MDDIFSKRTYAAELFEIYGSLLTVKQYEAMRLCYEEDCSLSEIAEGFHSTRQAVADLLKRACSLLEHYEAQLGLYAAEQKRSKALNKLEKITEQAVKDEKQKQEIKALLEEIGR